MTTIMSLPDEVIDIILGYSDITIEDINNFRCVCKKFREAAKYNKHQEKKFYQRWLSAKKLYDEQSKEYEQKESGESKQKKKEIFNFVKTGIRCARQLRKILSQLIHTPYVPIYPNHRYSNLIDNFTDLLRIYDLKQFLSVHEIHKPKNLIINFLLLFCDQTDMNFDYKLHNGSAISSKNFILCFFFIDELKNLLNEQSLRGISCDLNKKYCKTKLFHYMRQSLVRRKWRIYKGRSPEEQLFERIATIMAQWAQPEKDVFYSDVQASLDSIAQDVLKCIRQKYPDHSIFLTSTETISFWKNNTIDDNYWNETEGTQIIDTLQEYICNNLNFRSCPLNKYDNKLEYMCIDYVLKNKYGHGLILLIIYHSVARRLGLRCDILKVIKPSGIYGKTICLFWKWNYVTISLENVKCFNEILENWTEHPIEELLINGNTFKITANEIWKMLINMFDNTIYHDKVSKFIPRHINCVWPREQVHIYLRKPEQLNISRENIKFAVGMIVEHSNDELQINYTGVIIGWCRPKDISINYIKVEHNSDTSFTQFDNIMPFISCRNYKFAKQQINYIILTENNEICLVEEDTISLTTPKRIDNSEIGRYFCKFEGTHYVPTEMLAKVYPQDAAITECVCMYL